MARVKETEPRFSLDDDFLVKAKEYIFAKKQIEYFEAKTKKLRDDLFSAIEERGEIDSDGHIILDLDSDIDGVASFKKERRVSRKINEDLAKEIISQKGLRDRLIETKEVVNEDELMVALYEDLLTEEEVDEMFPQVITWALKLNKR